MSLKWYEEHMQAVVRQNQHLKFKLRKLEQKAPGSRIVCLFSSLFPEIPPLDEEVVAQKGVEGVLDYYQKVVHVWLQKEKAKMDFLLASPRKQYDVDSSLSTSKSTIALNKTAIQRKYRRCDLDHPSKDFTSKINQLEKKIREMREELEQFEINEHKYLGEIALLRSITKKLQYELSEKAVAEGKLKSMHLVKLRKANQECMELRREVAVWKEEYERIWLEQQQNAIDKQRQIRGNQRRGATFQSSSTTTSNVWTIRSTDFQRSYVIQK